jgi:hypothetical protein
MDSNHVLFFSTVALLHLEKSEQYFQSHFIYTEKEFTITLELIHLTQSRK